MNKILKNVLIGATSLGVVASVFIGTTFSKYTNKIIGNGETEVAKWHFEVNDQTEEFATIKLADTYDKSTLTNGKIAPGASGSFDLVIDASDSEVGVKYEVDFQDETNKPTNLKFKNGGQSFDNIDDLEQYLTDTIDADDTNKVRTLTIDWEWEYESDNMAEDDKVDTEDGINAFDYTVNVVVTGTQVNPTK